MNEQKGLIVAVTSKNKGLIAENRQARYQYHVGETLEVGLILTGSEVKSMRAGQTNITDGYVSVDDGELWLLNAYVAPYDKASVLAKHEERRKRKLLASRKEIAKLWNETRRKGMTIVPLRIYFNAQGRVKLLIALSKGKNQADKRATEAKRDWDRQKSRLLKENG